MRHLLLCCLLLIVPSQAFAYDAMVVKVADGDTITVLKDRKQIKIRLYGIDCPEKRQDFSKRAKQFTSALVFGKQVKVEPVTTDRYGRTVAWVSVDGKSLNRELIKAGLAWWFKKYAPDDKDLEELEIEARKAEVGLWVRSDAIPPWEYRKSRRNKQ
jgi:endonuclease YncB( thermonuclease family)